MTYIITQYQEGLLFNKEELFRYRTLTTFTNSLDKNQYSVQILIRSSF